jgi:hypothetical protein
MIAKTRVMTHLRVHSEILEIRLSDSLVATGRCPCCGVGSRRPWQESVTLFLLREKQVSAKLPSSMHLRATLLLTFG